MIKVKIANYQLISLKKNKPEIYAQMAEAVPGWPKADEIEPRYMDFEGYIQDIGLLPQEVIDIATWEAIRPMKILFEDKSSGRGIKEALAAYQVHLPGNELLGISAVEVREDLCTEELQRDLDRGWRIIAVCVRSGQRRPDYVLGRFTRH